MDDAFSVLDGSSPFAAAGGPPCGEVFPVFGGACGLQQQLFNHNSACGRGGEQGLLQQQQQQGLFAAHHPIASSSCGHQQQQQQMFLLTSTHTPGVGGSEEGWAAVAAAAVAGTTTSATTNTCGGGGGHDSSSMTILPTLGSSSTISGAAAAPAAATATVPVDVPQPQPQRWGNGNPTSGSGFAFLGAQQQQNTTAVADLLYLSSSPLKPWLPGSFPEDLQQDMDSLAAAVQDTGVTRRHPGVSPGDAEMLETLEALGLQGMGLSPCGTPRLPLQMQLAPLSGGFPAASGSTLARQLGGTVNGGRLPVNPSSRLHYTCGLAPLTAPTPTPLADGTAAAAGNSHQQQQGVFANGAPSSAAAAAAAAVNGSPVTTNSSAASGAATPLVNPGLPAFNALADFDFDLDLLEQLCREQIAVDEETAALAALGGLGLVTGVSPTPTPPLPTARAAAAAAAAAGMSLGGHQYPVHQQQQHHNHHSAPLPGVQGMLPYGHQQQHSAPLPALVVDCTALQQDVYARSFRAASPVPLPAAVNPGQQGLTSGGPAASTRRKAAQQQQQQRGGAVTALHSPPSNSSSGCSGLAESHCEQAAGRNAIKEQSTSTSTSSRVHGTSSRRGVTSVTPAGDASGAMRPPAAATLVAAAADAANAQRLGLLQQLVNQLLPMVDQGTASQLRSQLSASAAGGDMAASLTSAVTLLQKLQQQQQQGGSGSGGVGTTGVTQVSPGCDQVMQQPRMAAGGGLMMVRRGSSNLDRIPSSTSLLSLGGGTVVNPAKGQQGSTVNGFGQPQPRRKMLVFQRQRSTCRTAFTPSTLRLPSAATGQPTTSEGGNPGQTLGGGGQQRTASGALPSPGAASSTTSGAGAGGGSSSKRGLGAVVSSPVNQKAAKGGGNSSSSSKRQQTATTASPTPATAAAAAGRGGNGGGGGGVTPSGGAAAPTGSATAAGGGSGSAPAAAALPPPTPAAAGGGGGGVIVAHLDKSSSSPDLLNISSSSTAASSDECVAVQQAHALVKVLGRLTVDQLTACRPLLPQILAKSAPLLVPYCGAVHDMVGQCIAARHQSNATPGGQTLSPGDGSHLMMAGLQQLTTAQFGGSSSSGSMLAASPPAAAAAGGGSSEGRRRSASPGGTTAAAAVQEVSCMDYELATSMQVGRRQRRRCDSRTTLCIQPAGQSCDGQPCGSHTALTALTGPCLHTKDAAAAAREGQGQPPVLEYMVQQQQYSHAGVVNVPVLTSIDPRGPQDFTGMLMMQD